MAEPYCLAMVLCDGIHRDAATGKFTLLGTFSTLQSHEFPAQIIFSVYFVITDGLGDIKLRLRLVESSADLGGDDRDPVVEVSQDVVFQSPLMVQECVVSINTSLPKPGLYHCELYADQELLMSRRLLALGPDNE